MAQNSIERRFLMIFGFKEDKSKEEIYSKSEIDALIGGIMVHGESSPKTVSVGSYASFQIALSVPDGYTPVGILGVLPSTPNVSITNFYLNIPASTLDCLLRNSITEAVRNATVECWVLCLKEEFVQF